MDEQSGASVADRLLATRARLAERGADAAVLTRLDQVAWLPLSRGAATFAATDEAGCHFFKVGCIG